MIRMHYEACVAVHSIWAFKGSVREDMERQIGLFILSVSGVFFHIVREKSNNPY